MAHHSFAAYLFVILSCLSSSTTFLVKCSSNSNDLFQPDFLTVPTPEFLSSLQSTIETVREVTGVVSQFSSVFGDFRVSNAIADCLDLLDFSDDELNLTLSSAQNPNGKKGKTGNPSFDMRTWLSGALVNQDTCLEGFEGSNSYVHTLVSQSLNQITPLLHNILGQIHPMIPSSTVVGRGRKLMRTYEQQFPSWLKSHERKLLQTGGGGGGGVTADVVVAADGTGNYTSINDAISAAPELSAKRFVIYIKKGVYTEYVEIHKKKWNIMMIGDGMDVTVISGNRNFIDGWTTYRSATFGVKGQGFIARDITFQNTAGAEKHQAVAFRSDSDLSVLYRCAFRGYQDTLYAHSLRHFYKECTITGTVDFIFGDGSVVFQNCQIHARKGLPNQKNTITAQGRKDIGEPTGFSIQFSNISVESDVLTSLNSTETYLGRPWKLYSRTVIMQSYISDAIKPRGWLEWNGNFGLDSLYYGEYMNFGPGAGLSGRVNWTGFHAINDQSVANNYTVAQFILGNSWLPSTGVKYTAGLIV